jgi:hypothetical protein
MSRNVAGNKGYEAIKKIDENDLEKPPKKSEKDKEEERKIGEVVDEQPTELIEQK